MPSAGARYAHPQTAAGYAAYGTIKGEFDFSKTGTITSSGGSVSDVAPYSGSSSVHITQSTGSAQPTTGIRTQNSLNVLDFDGGDVLNGNPADSAQPLTIAAVAKFDSAAAFGYVVGHNAAGTVDPEFGSLGDGSWFYGAGGFANGGTVNTNAHIFIYVANGASSVLYVDGTAVISADGGGNDSTEYWVGNRDDLGGGIDGWIGHVIWYSTEVTNIAGLDGALNAQWAVH